MSEKIRPQHTARKAILYIRQSSAYQVSHNVESQKLQYAMEDRLQHLGWREIEVVDEDLGRSASGTVTRSGFERMVAQVCMGQVGAVAAREVSRFARNSREWQQLVEVCRVVDTVLIDQETVYTPRQSNDRLLLGLKGSLNEYELDLLRQRSWEARREKAKRGELIVSAPVGFVKTEQQRLEKDPDRRVQEAIRLVYQKFVEIGSVRQTLLWFLEHDLELPMHDAQGQTHWKRPYYGTVYKMLTHPAYGGAYVYGRREQTMEYTNGQPRHSHRKKPRAQWLSLIPNNHEGYVSWEQFEKIRTMIQENNRGPGKTGAIQSGPALLGGLLRCRRCGRKLMIKYTGNHHDVARYVCDRGWMDNGAPRCIAFGGITVDEAMAKEILRVVEPAAVEAAVLASKEETHKQDEVLEALRRDLEAARYAAQRAQKQYDATDPENRLVAGELERRWNQALERVRAIELRIHTHEDQHDPMNLPSVQEFEHLAADLESVWHSPDSDLRLKKAIVRTLIHEVVVDVDADHGELILIIHWKGGVHTELRLPRRRRGQNGAQTSRDIVEAVRVLARICSDDWIAAALNRSSLHTGRGNYWTRERVVSLRTYYEIPCYQADRRESEGWMNLGEAAKHIGISDRTLRLAIQRGEIEAQHPVSGGPWVLNRSALHTEAALRLVERVRHSRRNLTVPTSEQVNFDFSNT
jgi:DNA invertase Pin-like site-specific DNA recombinase